MGLVAMILEHPEELYPLVKLKMAAARIEKQIPAEEHWAFSYTMLRKVSRSFALVIQQLGPELRNAICIFYLVLRALDTVEDDTSIPTEIKVPILESFHRHIYDRDWHFSCGTKDYKVLMDKLHLVSTAFLELETSYQEAIEEITKKMGAGMAKFILKEVETVDDYDEYCHYVAGLVGLGLSKLFYASRLEELASDSLSNSMGLFLQKTNIIRDYLEDINEIPKSRMFWPREIWNKYANKLEDFKYEENSAKAVQCLNDLVTNALMHAEDCLQYMSALKDLAIFRFCAIPQIMAIGTLALCYNNVEIFRGVVKMRRGLVARVIYQTKNMSDVYGAFYEFSSLIKSKVDASDPNASLTLKRVEAIQRTCMSSGLLNRRGYHLYESKLRYNSVLIMVVLLLLSILFATLTIKW
ncbi:squalene synthase 1-like [Typha latifolia]|uniref:squalene synthase 1-like n=1 Tax=Typha latifolia TaxID=4733 RepID=UPI003C2EFED0